MLLLLETCRVGDVLREERAACMGARAGDAALIPRRGVNQVDIHEPARCWARIAVVRAARQFAARLVRDADEPHSCRTGTSGDVRQYPSHRQDAGESQAGGQRRK